MDFLWTALLAALVLGAASEIWARFEARRGARRTLEMNEALYSGTHEFVSIDPSRYRRLDARFYDETRAVLEVEGFRFLGDIEDLTITQQNPSMRTFIRVMSGDDGQVMAGFFHVAPRGLLRITQLIGLLPKRLQLVDLETELEDGRWLVTCNAEKLDTTPVKAPIEIERMPLRTPLKQLLSRHRVRLRAALSLESHAAARRVRSLNEAIAAQDRLQYIRNEQMAGREAIVETIRAAAGDERSKQLLIDEVRRA